MAWVASPPSATVPLALAPPLVPLVPLPHTRAVALVSASAMAIYDGPTLLPLALHTRPAQCVASHGPAVAAQACAAGSGASAGEDPAAVAVHVHVLTRRHHVLVFRVAVARGKALYEVVAAAAPARVLQNALPLAAGGASPTLGAMLRAATRLWVQGAAGGSGMASTEHFAHGAADDAQRGSHVPLARAALVQILRFPAPVLAFWGRAAPRGLAVCSAGGVLLFVDVRTGASRVVRLRDHAWYRGTVLVARAAGRGCVLHVDKALEVALLETDADDDGSDDADSGGSSVKHTPLLRLDAPPRSLEPSPCGAVVLVDTPRGLGVYVLGPADGRVGMRLVAQVAAAPDGPLALAWLPCGGFFHCVARGRWTLHARFGAVLFDSAQLAADMGVPPGVFPGPDGASPGVPFGLGRAAFCRAALCAVALNGRALYVVDAPGHTLYKIDLVRRANGLFEDTTYLSRLQPGSPGLFVRVPVPPFAQRYLEDLQWPAAPDDAPPVFTARVNRYAQMSLAHGALLAISTPTHLGLDCRQVYWFQFYNHLVAPLNVVDHIWIDGYLLVASRVAHDSLRVDELLLLNTPPSRNAAGGQPFRFDSDLLLWRHTFKNRVLRMVVAGHRQLRTLVLATHDFKLILVDFDMAAVGLARAAGPRISIRVRRTIHLSSIRHKLHISDLADMLSVDNTHFFFLLRNGDCFLLKNQALAPGASLDALPSHMYDLVRVNCAVDRLQVCPVLFAGNSRHHYLALYKGDSVLLYDLRQLLDRPHEFEGAERSDVAQLLGPIETQAPAFTPVLVLLSDGTIAISGFESLVLWKNENLIIKHRPARLLILNKLVLRDLLSSDLTIPQINEKYSGFNNYTHCLELLLFEQLDYIDDEGSFDKVCGVINAHKAADSIYVSFLRKIEVHFWDKFFRILELTPMQFMAKLIRSQNVDLCYNYLNIYLNFKKEHERASSPEDSSSDNEQLLGETEQVTILQIVALLKKDDKWDECFELCRFIKLLEPLGSLLARVRACVASA
ncbi:hypothetical protein METBIDRAFT_71936 [Metschnikowia bicuspidata var. bicuspidata NRRL YB-4993]|uniref:RIC1 C-terminal alpha solenoid region domain-containing protein n=1 Tax=Metschnikowia bicuspidata var. bicuspidata NRRL YB-4993 TaxID=869754 RepID=A0A1A0H9P7_9ASCO|nr:hypothetical protein METBIDRAFT_71936 [Metschnikowia bicuspidata var. bicuspidata NRRL YB-4993]OBA20715.1 hypothetical protein METBIDRAFT_71936 [Metschnikowia bicuspidata var. bicuspidata NRRL YB-4993]